MVLIGVLDRLMNHSHIKIRKYTYTAPLTSGGVGHDFRMLLYHHDQTTSYHKPLNPLPRTSISPWRVKVIKLVEKSP